MKKNKYQRLYDLLIHGFPQTKICRLLRSDKGQISRMTNTLVDNGFLVCINNRDRVRFYEATKKKLTEEDTVILSTMRQKGTRNMDERVSFVRIHAIKYVSTVVSMGKVPWEREWVCKGVYHRLFHFPFKNVGNVGFEWIQGKTKSSLLVMLPSLKWCVRSGNPDEHLRRVVGICYSWFMKNFHCVLGGLRQCGRGHFELPVHNKALVSLAQVGSFKHGDLILDSSLGYPEFGSVGGYDPLDMLFKCPGRLDVLEKRMDHLESVLERISVKFDKLDKQLEHLSRLFDVPVRVDERLDVT